MEANPVYIEMNQKTNRDKDVTRKRQERSESARIVIPECVNPKRREDCLQDPERFMRTYLPRKFRQPFAKVHRKLISEIWDRAQTGGRKGLAAPRGRGKSTIVKGMNIALVAAEKVRFIVPICATTKLAGRLYRDFQYEIGHNDLLLEDFPEICWPVRALEGAPQRAPRQHIDGQRTNIYWSTTDFLRLATVPGNANNYLQSLGNEWSPYGGVKMTFCGLDAAFRGLNIDDDRPDYLIIDDPETRESAKSQEQIDNRIETIERDVEGLEGQEKPIAMVMITTIQNTYCLSAQFTDPEKRPAWGGERFGWVVKWPTREDLWEQYIELRKTGQTKGERHGLAAIEFYLANKDEMDLGYELLADTFKQTRLLDGTQLVFSAIQEVYNKISDTSKDSFFTEYQNDPPEIEKIQTLGLTYQHVLGCLSGTKQFEIPEWSQFVVRAIDMGKVNCWYTDLAFAMDGTFSVVDYGKFQTFGLTTESTHEAIESAMLSALDAFIQSRDEYKIDIGFIDSGYKPEAIYEACKRIDGQYYPVKGPDSASSRFSMPQKATPTCMPYFECYANEVLDKTGSKLWLFHPNTEHWKNWIQERLMLAPWTDKVRTVSSGAIFDPPHGDARVNTPFAKSMISERLTHIPLPGKGYKTVWEVIDRNNNHWLDCMGYAASAAAVLGVRLVPTYTPPVTEKQQPKREAINPYARHGRAFLATQR